VENAVDASRKYVLEVQERPDSFLRHIGRVALFYVSLPPAGAFVAFVVEMYRHFPAQRPLFAFALGVFCSAVSALVLTRLDVIQPDRIGVLFQASLLEWKARSVRRNAVADTLMKLRDLKNQMQREFGKQLFTALGDCNLVVIMEDDYNYFGCLFFQRAMEDIGFRVSLLQADFRVGVQHTMFSIYFTLRSSPSTTAIPLLAIASGDIKAWDILREAIVIMIPTIPHEVDLQLRRYFELAASKVLPPESLGATSGVTSYR
jgi:hypothetical protein